MIKTSKNRVIPLTCEDIYRIACENLGKIIENELHTTSDQHRIFMDGYHAGPVWHGTVTNEEAMLELTLPVEDGGSIRGVFPLDWCYNASTGSFWMCITNRGETIEDWREFPAGTASEDIVDGLHALDELEVVLDGGNADSEFDDIVDGNDPFFTQL